MKKLLIALLCFAMLSQLVFPVWAEDGIELELDPEILFQDAQTTDAGDVSVVLDEIDPSVLDTIDDIALDGEPSAGIALGDVDNDLPVDTDGEILPETVEQANGAEDFEIINGVLVEYKGNGGAVTIPNGVTAIAERAFQYCKGVTSVTISNGVTSIGQYAFVGCRDLVSVKIPGSVIEICHGAFYSCENMTSVSLSEGLERINDCAFSNCRSITELVIPNSVILIGENINSGTGAFSGCISLKKVTLPKQIKKICGSTFHSCSSLEKIVLPYGVEEIGSYAFCGCSSLEELSSVCFQAKKHRICRTYHLKYGIIDARKRAGSHEKACIWRS